MQDDGPDTIATSPSQKDDSSGPQPNPGTTATPIITQEEALPFVLARHRSDDCYFDVRLTEVELTHFHSKTLVHQLSFRLDLARPFEDIKRIRAAQLTITVTDENETGSTPSGTTPEILAITPEASLIHMADHEVTTGQTVGLTAGAPPAAGGSLTANANLSWGDKTTFEGNRLVHGFIPSRNQAQWKMYEESRSKSGLPPVLYFLIVLRARRDFRVTAQLHIHRWTGWRLLGFRKRVPAEPSAKGYLVTKDLLEEPGQKPFEVSDDLLKLLEESDKKRETLRDMLRTHCTRLNNTIQELEKGEGLERYEYRLFVSDADREIEDKFELWRMMAESDEQLEALRMLNKIARDMLQDAHSGYIRKLKSDIVEIASTSESSRESLRGSVDESAHKGRQESVHGSDQASPASRPESVQEEAVKFERVLQAIEHKALASEKAQLQESPQGSVELDPVVEERLRELQEVKRLAEIERMKERKRMEERKRIEQQRQALREYQKSTYHEQQQRESGMFRQAQAQSARQQRFEGPESGRLITYGETKSKAGGMLFGKKKKTAEEALANHRAVSKSWNESKL